MSGHLAHLLASYLLASHLLASHLLHHLLSPPDIREPLPLEEGFSVWGLAQNAETLEEVERIVRASNHGGNRAHPRHNLDRDLLLLRLVLSLGDVVGRGGGADVDGDVEHRWLLVLLWGTSPVVIPSCPQGSLPVNPKPKLFFRRGEEVDRGEHLTHNRRR